VSNVEGSSISTVAQFIIADVPDKPSSPPYKVLETSGNTSLDINIDPLSEVEKGGSEILGYQIQVDDG
jgi:hypothetical protein